MRQNNLDKLFQEKFQEINAKPSIDVWKTIKVDLLNKSPKRRFFLWKLSFASLIIFIFLIILIFYTNFQKVDLINPTKLKNKIVSKDSMINRLENKKILKNTSKEIIGQIKKDTLQKEKGNSEKPKENSYTTYKGKIKVSKQSSSKKNKTISKKEKSFNRKKIKKERNKIAEKTPFKERQQPKNLLEKKSIKKSKKAKDLAKENLKKSYVNKMFTSVFTIISNGVFSNRNPLDKNLKETVTKGNFTFSYGLKGEFFLQKNSSIQFGFFLQKLKYTTSNIAYVSGVSGSKLENIDYRTSSLFIHVTSSNNFDINNFVLSTGSTNSTNAKLIQEYDYIEIPIEYVYKKVVYTNIDTYYIGGFSTLFLTKNTISIQAANFSKELGKANNINNLNFSANLGVKFEYLFNDHWKFNISPMFKVYLHTFSKNSNGFMPYSLNLYSGIKYQF